MDGCAPADGSGPIDESVHGRPEPALREHIAWYSGYRQAGLPPTTHRGLPSPYMTLILTLDDPLTLLAHPDSTQSPGDYEMLLGGLHTTPALVGHDGRQSGIQIALRPLGARSLLGLPAGELGGIDVHAEDVLGRDGVEARERLRLALDWPSRFAVLDDWLLRRLRRRDENAATASPEVVRAWQLLIDSRGGASVAAVATDIGWSTRHLSGRFALETGLTPKAAARVIRFDRARRLLAERARRGPDQLWPDRRQSLGLADLAAECGYFDQAHLDREFRTLAGCAPRRWLAEEFRNVQSGAHTPRETGVEPGGDPAGARNEEG